MRTNAQIVVMVFLLLLGCQSPTDSLSTFSAAHAAKYAADQWRSLDSILAHIHPPDIPLRSVHLQASPSAANNRIDRRFDIQNAIDGMHDQGGGTIYLAEGTYFVRGPIHLKSNVRLHLNQGASLLFSDQYEDYLPLVKVRWEGTICWNFSPLIYAHNATNIALTGKGEIDGNGKNWSIEWRKKQKADKNRLRQMGNDTIPDEQRVLGD